MLTHYEFLDKARKLRERSAIPSSGYGLFTLWSVHSMRFLPSFFLSLFLSFVLSFFSYSDFFVPFVVVLFLLSSSMFFSVTVVVVVVVVVVIVVAVVVVVVPVSYTHLTLPTRRTV